MTQISLSAGLAALLAVLPGALSALSPTPNDRFAPYRTLQPRLDAQGRCQVVAHAAATDRVMGYTDQPTPADVELPANMQSWLDCVDRAAQFVSLHPEYTLGTASQSSTVIRPLLGNIKWNQSAPWDGLCPAGTPVGCVATAMAQVLYYYRYPEHGFGSKTYTNNGVTHHVDFENTYYAWDQMFDAYDGYTTPAQNHAVAELSYHCGVAVNMDYSPGGSGAWTELIPHELHKYFGYNSKASTQSRSEYTYAEWCDLLIAELQAGRPVIFAGTSSDVGHCFVIDGVNREGLFHVNWGWGGYYNGYFDIGILDPEGQGIGGSVEATMGYCLNQRAVVQLCPEEGIGEDLCPLTCELFQFWEDGGQYSIGLTFQNNSGDNYHASLTGEIINTDGEVCLTSESVGFDFTAYPKRGYWQWHYFDFGAMPLPDGEYRFRVACVLDSQPDVVYRLNGNRGYYLRIVVENGHLWSENNSDETFLLSIDGLNQPLDQVFAVGRPYPFEFDVTNTSQSDFVGQVIIYSLQGSGYDTKGFGYGSPDLHLLPGETRHLEIPIVYEEEGDWRFSIAANDYGYNLEATIWPVETDFIPVSSAYTDDSPAYLTLITDPEVITERCEAEGEATFRLTLDNGGGNFSSKLAMQFFTNKSVLTKPTLSVEQEQYVPKSSQGNVVDITGRLTGLKGMTKYYVRPYYEDLFGEFQPLQDKADKSPLLEVRVYNASGIECIQADEATDVPAYDLMGRRVAADRQGVSVSRQGISLR